MNSHSILQQKRYFLAMIALIGCPISGFSIDIYVPSLPAVEAYFQVPSALVQLTITTYLIGFGAMQLIAGTLADCFGRRIPFILFSLVYIVASIIIPFSYSIYLLLFLRFIQGCAVACINVSNRAILSDLFEGKEFYKMMNYMTLAWAIGPIVAPAIGGYLQHYFGWKSSFYFLTAYGVILFIMYLFLVPETTAEFQEFKVKKILLNYRKILSNIEFILGLITLGVIYSFLILFSIIGPFLIQIKLHQSAIQFGHIALLMGVFWFLGNILNRFLLEFTLPNRTVITLISMVCISLTMVLLALKWPLNLYVIVIPTFFLAFLASSLFPNGFSHCVMLFPRLAATANSLVGAFLILIASACSALATLLQADNSRPLTVAYFIMCLIMLMIYFLSLKLSKNADLVV